MDIKEIALKVAGEIYDVNFDEHKPSGKRLISFAEALVTEIAKQNEPVYAFRRKGLDDFCTCDKQRFDELSQKTTLFEVRVFYTIPPSVEAIENKVAEACALQVATETKFHWLDAARVAKEIRSGEWRKHMKGD
jgi:hypothetical protein